MALQIDATPNWERVAPVDLQTVCVRHVPDKTWNETQINVHNQTWIEKINKSGKAYLTSSLLKGKRIARISIGVETTESIHVEHLWKLMQEQVTESSNAR